MKAGGLYGGLETARSDTQPHKLYATDFTENPTQSPSSRDVINLHFNGCKRSL